MAKSFSKKRPTFIQFRQSFVEFLEEKFGKDITEAKWTELSDEKTRALLLAAFKDKIVQEYNMGENLEIRSELINLQGSVESVASQLFHAFSTLALMEHINETVLEKRKEKLNN